MLLYLTTDKILTRLDTEMTPMLYHYPCSRIQYQQPT